MFKLFLVINLAVISLTTGHVIREAPAAPNSEISLETIFTIAENGLKKVQEVVLESFDAADTDDLKNKAHERGESLLNKLKTWATNIKETTEEWKDNVSVKELREIADNAIEGLKSDHPKLTSEITNYIDNVTKTSGLVIEQIKLLSNSPESAQIKELSGKLVEATKQSFVLIGNEVKDVAKTTTKDVAENVESLVKSK